ncbi:related to FAD/FMN-containing isoamyl alcohol oxidase MreA-like, putative [Cephalotrichum gorgonifer]|uniref:Related to FAD/FMN-containing isoamyl alcohol oxidase MreA-like, putative n=1 Tax=Cephalotrichum gorgonifer TaxID=2041049 RepID=A0AAE8N8S4_9PEZI|nr:related to FAD/FMN-containing isoamyl alcohol oxidase MreA-like, putative [Cephalotrichum gorgonifer]
MTQFWAFSFVVLAGSLLSAASGSKCSTRCRCLPTEPCWPSDADWQSLNETVGGQLSQVSPLGAVCHDPSYNADVCNELVMGATYNSSLRAADPGAGQWANWEAWGEKNETCYVGTQRDIRCGQGRVSPYSVAAASANDIVEAVKFATKHNVRLVVKNTGHDFAGRSLAPHSLQVQTRPMRDIKFAQDFVPDGAKKGVGPAVTIGAGVQLFELYQFCHKKNVTVVAGFSSTVGAAGGYIQGGGHSILSPWKGLASDNVLQYTVVTAYGNHVTANSHQNKDLFWALRGGGGGTFGIVTSVTFAAHSNPPLTSFTMDIVRPTADTAFWKLVESLYENIPALNDFGTSISSLIYPETVAPSPVDGSPESGRALFTVRGFLVGNTEGFPSALTSLEDAWRAEDSDNGTLSAPADFRFNVTTFPSITDFYVGYLTGEDRGGASTLIGSHLVSRDFIASPGGPAAIADAFSKIKLSPNEAISGNVVAGGAVASSKVDSAVHPSWKRALSHMMIVRGWENGTPLNEQRALQEEITNVQVPILQALELPGEEMGAYLNEADAYEPDFQRSFWGANYQRLYKIKEKWDPRGVFIVRKGVGSENWDEEGICRKG